MSRLQEYITMHGLTIDIHPLIRGTTPYTLHMGSRTLQGKIFVTDPKETITCEDVLWGIFLVIDDGNQREFFQEEAQKSEGGLRTFLGERYEPFWQAFLADEEERRQKAGIIKVNIPEEQHNPQDDEDGLKHLTSHQIQGKRIVYFDAIVLPHIYAGFVENVEHTSLEELAASGIIATVTLLQADNHEHLCHLFFQTYLYSNKEPPEPGVYAWPRNLPPQTFRQPKRRGHRVSFQMKLPDSVTVIIASADFSEGEEADNRAHDGEDHR